MTAAMTADKALRIIAHFLNRCPLTEAEQYAAEQALAALVPKSAEIAQDHG